jgi:hypothetical protein
MYFSFGIAAAEVLAVEQRRYVAQKVRASPSWIQQILYIQIFRETQRERKVSDFGLLTVSRG